MPLLILVLKVFAGKNQRFHTSCCGYKCLYCEANNQLNDGHCYGPDQVLEFEEIRSLLTSINSLIAQTVSSIYHLDLLSLPLKTLTVKQPVGMGALFEQFYRCFYYYQVPVVCC